MDPCAPSFIPGLGSTKTPCRSADPEHEPSSRVPYATAQPAPRSSRAYESRWQWHRAASVPERRVKFSEYPDCREIPLKEDDYKGKGKEKGAYDYSNNDNDPTAPSSTDAHLMHPLFRRFGINPTRDRTSQFHEPAFGFKIPSESGNNGTATPVAPSSDRRNRNNHKQPSSNQFTSSNNFARSYSYRPPHLTHQFIRTSREIYPYSDNPMQSYSSSSTHPRTATRAPESGPLTLPQLQTEYFQMLDVWTSYSEWMNHRIYQQGVKLGLYPPDYGYGYGDYVTPKGGYGVTTTEDEDYYDGYIDGHGLFHSAPRD